VKKAPEREPSSLRNHILESCVGEHAESLLTVQIRLHGLLSPKLCECRHIYRVLA
jgi:hypothetical protein